MAFAGEECTFVRAVEPATSDESKEKPIPDEGDGSSVEKTRTD